MKTISILIIDDHRLVRDGIKAMLASSNEDFNFAISEAECGEDGIKRVVERDFDIVLVDYQLPDIKGPEVISRILVHKPKSKTLAISTYDEYACIQNMINAGACGYVLKNVSPGDLVKAIQTVLAGKKYFSNEVLEKIVSNKEGEKESNKHKEIIKKLQITKRQIEVLKLVVTGMTNEAISKKLNLSKRTIDGHRQHLLDKLDANNTATLIKRATELSLL